MEQLLSAHITTKEPTSGSPGVIEFKIVYRPPPATGSEAHEDLSQRLQAKDEELSARLQDVEALKKKLEEMKLEYDTLSATHQTLILSHKELIGANAEVHRSLSELESTHETLKSTHSQLVYSLEEANSVLRSEISRLEAELQKKEEQVRKLAALIKERDSRKKNAEKLLDQVERRNKELVEDHVRKELEIEELKKKCAEYLVDLQRLKEDLAPQDELRRKREDQVQALLSQLKRKEQENARLARELKRREEENKGLASSIQTIAAKTEKEIRLKMQKELEQVRGRVAAKEGVMQAAKEIIGSYRRQLERREDEAERFRKKAEARKPGRLPPLDSQSSVDKLPSKSSLKSKVSSTDFSKKRSPPRVSEDDEALEELIAQSQQAFAPGQLKSPRREPQTQLNRGSSEKIEKETALQVELMQEPTKKEEASPLDDEGLQSDQNQAIGGGRNARWDGEGRKEEGLASASSKPTEAIIPINEFTRNASEENFKRDQSHDAVSPQRDDTEFEHDFNQEFEDEEELPLDDQHYDYEQQSEDGEVPPPLNQSDFDADAAQESP